MGEDCASERQDCALVSNCFTVDICLIVCLSVHCQTLKIVLNGIKGFGQRLVSRVSHQTHQVWIPRTNTVNAFASLQILCKAFFCMFWLWLVVLSSHSTRKTQQKKGTCSIQEYNSSRRYYAALKVVRNSLLGTFNTLEITSSQEPQHPPTPTLTRQVFALSVAFEDQTRSWIIII